MKKIAAIMILTVFFMSCDRKTSELVLVNPSNQESVNEEISNKDSSDSEKKPLQILSKEDELQIWYKADGAPGMFINDQGEPEGFYIELEEAVMKEMGQKHNFNAYSDLGPLIQNIKSGVAHSALSTVDVIDYRTLANISDTYEELNYVLFLNKESDIPVPDNRVDAISSLYGKKVGVQTRANIYQVLRDYKEIEIIEYPTTTIAMEALSRGEVDAVPEVKRIGVYYSKKNNLNVKPVGVPILSQNIGTGFSKALDTSIVDRYNTALNTLIDSGFVEELYISYFGE